MFCKICDKELQGRKRSFCSNSCKNKHHNSQRTITRFSQEDATALLLENIRIDPNEAAYPPVHFKNGVIVDYNVKGLEGMYMNTSSTGYARIACGGTTVFLHKLLLLCDGHEITEGMQVDHINRNKLDNRLSNLRVTTPACNNQNKPVLSKKRNSQYKGVHKTASGKWQAIISIRDKNIGLGSYDTQEQAALAYNAKARELHGSHAYQNVIKDCSKQQRNPR